MFKDYEVYKKIIFTLWFITLIYLVFNFSMLMILVFVGITLLNVLFLIVNKNVIKETQLNSNINSLIVKTFVNRNYAIISYDSDTKKIDWQNDISKDLLGDIINSKVDEIYNNRLLDESCNTISILQATYDILRYHNIIVLRNINNLTLLEEELVENENCIAFIKMDNLIDMSAGVDELAYQNMTSAIRKDIVDYANKYDSVLRKYKDDGYIMIFKRRDYYDMIENKFEVIENVKKHFDEDDSNRITISMGISIGFNSLKDLENEAGYSLDMALARGGDQVVVKKKDQNYEFYGGNSEAVEKRNKVKLRVIVDAMQKLAFDASNIIIMTHSASDFDAIGSALGISKFVTEHNANTYVLLNMEDAEPKAKASLEILDIDECATIVDENQALKLIDDKTLLIITDTSSTTQIESLEVYQNVKNCVVIDHHRPTNTFFENPILTYIEPYASSTSELVVEMLCFQNQNYRLLHTIATFMLAGIMIDSNYFTIRTGSRTFEAAMYLRENNASPLQVKELLQESREIHDIKMAMISNAMYSNDNIAIAIYDKTPVTRALLAQGAVELLDVKGTIASFMIGILEDGKTGISARSNGEFNVENVLEKFGGGGHLSMAAAQIDNNDLGQVKDSLLTIIEKNK